MRYIKEQHSILLIFLGRGPTFYGENKRALHVFRLFTFIKASEEKPVKPTCLVSRKK